MRVLYVDSPLDPPGGGQISLLALLDGLPEVDKTVFLDSPGSFFSELGRHRVNSRVVPGAELYRAMRELKPDLVHCNSATTRYTFRAALAARRCGLPFVWHNRVAERGGWRERLIATLSARVIVISDAVGEKFGYCREKLRRIYNGVDTEVFFPASCPDGLKSELGISPQDRVVGVFSRFDKWKGHDLFLEAAARLPGRLRAGTSLLLVGEGSSRSRVRELAAKHPFADKIIFTGFREDIPELLRLCDIVVNPSKKPEGFGRVLIEAMACGRPVVSTVLGGPLEILESGRDGLLVEPEPAALAAAIVSLLPGGGLDAAAMGAEGRNKVLEKFDASNYAKEIAGVYREVMGGAV